MSLSIVSMTIKKPEAALNGSAKFYTTRALGEALSRGRWNVQLCEGFEKFLGPAAQTRMGFAASLGEHRVGVEFAEMAGQPNRRLLMLSV